MNKIGQYLLSIVAAALLVSICNTLVEKKGAISSVIRLITGIVLALLVVSPWTDLRISDPLHSFSYIDADAAMVVQQGKQVAQNEVSQSIKEQMEAYILDKAFDLGMHISAEVHLTEEIPPCIKSVSIYGSASPYAKGQFKRQICNDLGITEECLTWFQSNG